MGPHLKATRTRAIDLVTAIDDLVGRLKQDPPAGWLPGEQPGVDPQVCAQNWLVAPA